MTETAKTTDPQRRQKDGSRLITAPGPVLSLSISLTGDLFENGLNAATFDDIRDRTNELSIFAYNSESFEMIPSEKAKRFKYSLRIPKGSNAGKPLQIAPYQLQFIGSAKAYVIANTVLSIGRGNRKSTITARLSLGGLTGVWDRLHRREFIAAVRTRDQGRIIWNFVASFVGIIPLEIQRHFIFRRDQRLEVEHGDGDT